MFDAQIITTTFFISAFGVIILNFAAEKIKASKEVLKFILIIALISSLYNAIAGMSMIFDWVDPLSKASPEQIGRAAGRRRGGLVLLLISFWPYILTAFGSFMSWVYLKLLSLSQYIK
jgi:hypothetical protein